MTKNTSGGTATASASGGKSGGTTAAAPAAPKNGTYTFWPRPQATVAGSGAGWYLDKVVITGNYLTVYVSSTERGENRDGGNMWSSHVSGSPTVLDSEDRPGRQWNPVRYGTEGYGGVFFSFEKVVGKRFTMNTPNYMNRDSNPPMTLEITLGEPDQ